MHVRTGTHAAQSVQLPASRQAQPKVLGTLASSEQVMAHPVAVIPVLSFPDMKALKQDPVVGGRDFKVQKLKWKTAATDHLSNETGFISVSKCVCSTKTF